MTAVPSRYVRITLVLCAGACIATSLFFMYRAGCAGDLKGGALGDPLKALAIESNGVALGWLAAVLLAAVASTLPWSHTIHRVTAVIFALVVGWGVMTISGIHFETQGVQSCFP
jgi:hypothetical protein